MVDAAGRWERKQGGCRWCVWEGGGAANWRPCPTPLLFLTPGFHSQARLCFAIGRTVVSSVFQASKGSLEGKSGTPRLSRCKDTSQSPCFLLSSSKMLSSYYMVLWGHREAKDPLSPHPLTYSLEKLNPREVNIGEHLCLILSERGVVRPGVYSDLILFMQQMLFMHPPWERVCP